jgi:gamma-glutamylcyclotransferase (GGCT)/AIG2-like uncharacterized protein YtfP
MTQRIFVYGTLKRGLSNHAHVAGQRFIGEARTAPQYRMVDCGGYPGMFAVDQGGLSVIGEVWEVDEANRKQLDVLEGVAEGMYALEPVALLAPFHDAKVSTYVYRWPVLGHADAGHEWMEK